MTHARVQAAFENWASRLIVNGVAFDTGRSCRSGR
jgi:hypothetical protein